MQEALPDNAWNIIQNSSEPKSITRAFENPHFFNDPAACSLIFIIYRAVTRMLQTSNVKLDTMSFDCGLYEVILWRQIQSW